MAVPKKDVLDELHTLSDKISSQTRSIGLGLIAVVWALITGSKDVPPVVEAGKRHVLLIILLLSIVALLVDYLQYVSGYLNDLRLVRKAEMRREEAIVFHKSGFLYRFRAWCFVGKQITILSAVVLLAVVLLTKVGGG